MIVETFRIERGMKELLKRRFMDQKTLFQENGLYGEIL